MNALSALLAFALAVPALPNGIEHAHVPLDAVIFAAADIQTLPEEERQFTRYVWLVNPDKDIENAVRYTVHAAISRASDLVPLVRVADGQLLRLNLSQLAPRTRDGKFLDLEELVFLWDDLAGRDKYFYVKGEKKVIQCSPYIFKDGKEYKARNVQTVAFGPHTGAVRPDGQIDLVAGALLQQLAKCMAPITRYDNFIANALSTANDGLYYQFTQITKSPNKNQTDFEFFLDKHFGVDREKFLKLQATRKALLTRSNVTTRARAILAVRAPRGLVTWTEDLEEGNDDPAFDPFKNLIDGKFDATEAIGLNERGFQLFGIFDGKGALVDAVPVNIAFDTTVPTGFIPELRPGVACIRCHSIDKGYRTASNDLLDGLRAHAEYGMRFDLLEKDPNRLDTIKGLYKEQIQWFNTARAEYSDAVFLSTGGNQVSKVGAAIQKAHNEHEYADVTAVRACVELGYRVEAKHALSVLKYLLRGTVGMREDPNIFHLSIGKRLPVRRWREIYIDAAIRARQNGLEGWKPDK